MGEMGWIIVTVLGLCVGIGLGFWLGRSQGGSDSTKLAEVEAELADYRTQVSEHFSQSASHFQAIGRQYRELYEHMATGSQDLCEQSGSDKPLSFPSPEAVVALEDARTDVSRADEPGGAPTDYAADDEGLVDSDEEPSEQQPSAPSKPLAAEQEVFAGPEPGFTEEPKAEEPKAEEPVPAAETEPESDKRLYH